MKQRTLAALLAALILIWLGIPRHKPNPYKVESIIDYQAGVTFHYPVTGKAELDEKIKAYVDSTIDEFINSDRTHTTMYGSFGCYSSLFTAIRFQVTYEKEGAVRDIHTKETKHKNFFLLWGDAYLPVMSALSSGDESVTPQPKSTKKQIALTFDDGPSAHTGEILTLLEDYGFNATFCVLGTRVDSHREIVSRIYTSGSEIANHTFDHLKLTSLEPAEITDQVSKTQEAVKAITGEYPRFLRPTYGAINAKVRDTVGMPLLMWNVDTMDWKSKNPDYIFQQAIANLKDGDIILFHDIYPSTVEAIRKLLPYLKENGFQAVTASQLFDSKGVNPEEAQAYFTPSNKT